MLGGRTRGPRASIVRFELAPSGKGTKLVFDQAGDPADAEAMLEGGWPKMYWEPMNVIFAEVQRGP